MGFRKGRLNTYQVFAVSFIAGVIVGCTTPVRDDRICLDWDTVEETRQRCIPMYGNIICADETVVRRICKFYHVEPIREEENAN